MLGIEHRDLIFDIDGHKGACRAVPAEVGIALDAFRATHAEAIAVRIALPIGGVVDSISRDMIGANEIDGFFFEKLIGAHALQEANIILRAGNATRAAAFKTYRNLCGRIRRILISSCKTLKEQI